MADPSERVPLTMPTIQIVRYVNTHPGCTGAEVKERLGLPLDPPQMRISPIGPADSILLEKYHRYVFTLVQSRFLRTDRAIWQSENSSHLWVTSAGREALEGHKNRVIEVLKYIRGGGPCSVEDIGKYWQSLPPKVSTADVLLRRSRALDYNLDHYERIHPLECSGLVELSGGLAEEKHTVVRLTEKGLASLANGPRSILRTLYGPA